MTGFFVTGTDTGVGKTVLSALACLALEADYFKPLQTGQESDTRCVADLAGLSPERLHPPAFHLAAPLAPSQAAALEGLTLDAASVRLPDTPRPLIVEGAGGALVPIGPGQDMAWLMIRLGLPVLVAARSGLGTINHTLLTLEALDRRGLDVAGVALIGEPNPANRRDIERLGGLPVVLELPRLPRLDRAGLLEYAPALLQGLARAGRPLDTSGTRGGSQAESGSEKPRDRSAPSHRPPSSPDEVAAWDAAHVWRPFTQAASMPEPGRVLRASGARLFLDDGRELLDMISSWWVNPHGHAHPAVARAVARQAAVLEQVIFADFAHEPAARLAHELSALLPGGLCRVFFSDNGSSAVEAALKMAHQYWRNQGRPERTRFAALQGGYHGDTVGAMSVGLSSGFYAGFEPLTFQVDFLPCPATWHGDAEVAQREDQALAVLRNYFAVHAGTVAGVILEPLVQGASGMRMTRPGFVRAVADLCREAGGLVIFDEVMTGFGRTGTLFACQRAATAPDIICLAKGLTAGFTPMAVTVATETVYQGFLGDTFDRALAHGHSFTANPIGCAAALAGLALFASERSLERVAALEAVHASRLSALAGHPRLARPRWLGCIGAVEIAGEDSGYGARCGKKLKRYFMERGLFIRPLGEVFYLMPPYCLTPEELHGAYDTLEQALESI